jgi:flagellar basal-body rod protein FlgG
LALVRERRVESRESPNDPTFNHDVLDELTGGSLVAPTYTAFEQGPAETTGRPLDVMIDGEGFFAVQDQDQVRYTRDGRFAISESGELVMRAGGRPVMSTQGSPIRIGKASGPVKIDGEGAVKAGDTIVGQIGVVDFEDKALLRKSGGNLIQPLGTAPRDKRATLLAGTLEGSTVDPTMTMVQMMQATRSYELNARMVGLADSTLGRAVNDIARIA